MSPQGRNDFVALSLKTTSWVKKATLACCVTHTGTRLKTVFTPKFTPIFHLRRSRLRANPLILLAICVNTPIDHKADHNWCARVVRCSASCVNWALRSLHTTHQCISNVHWHQAGHHCCPWVKEYMCTCTLSMALRYRLVWNSLHHCCLSEGQP